MLTLHVRSYDQNYSSPANYWLEHLNGIVAAAPESPFEQKVVIRRAQMRRLRYKQTHCWLVRLWHALVESFSRSRPALTAC